MPISAVFLPISNLSAGVSFTYCCFVLAYNTSSPASLAAVIKVDGISRDKLPDGSGKLNDNSVLLVASFLRLKYFRTDMAT